MSDGIKNAIGTGLQGLANNVPAWGKQIAWIAYVIPLAIILVYFVILSLTAYNLRIATLNIRDSLGRPISYSEVISSWTYYRQASENAKNANERILENRQRIVDERAKISEIISDQARKIGYCRDLISSYFKREDIFSTENKTADIAKLNCDENVSNVLQQLSSGFSSTNQPEKLETVNRLLETVKVLRADFNASENAKKDRMEEIRRLASELKQDQDLIDGYDDQSDKQDDAKQEEAKQAGARQTDAKPAVDTGSQESKTNEQDAAIDIQIAPLMGTLDYLRTQESYPYLGYVIPDFSTYPPDTLALIMVICMGGLGAVVTMIRNDFKGKEVANGKPVLTTIGERFLPPFLGAVTALVVFVIAKSGALVIGSTDAANSMNSINPYFIGFLALVSGLLTDDALDLITRTGLRYFSGNGNLDAPRWGVGLKAALASLTTAAPGQPAKTEEELFSEIASLMKTDGEAVKAWFYEERTATETEQNMLSAYLRTPVRELFTDIPGK